jgi:simple sugar transport system substrate-binding protein
VTPDPVLDRSELVRWLGLAAAGTAMPFSLGESDSAAFLKPHPRWRFVFVNHATTNPFFIPT